MDRPIYPIKWSHFARREETKLTRLERYPPSLFRCLLRGWGIATRREKKKKSHVRNDFII